MLPGDPGFLASVPLPAKTSLCLPDHRWRTELLGGAGTRRQEESRVIQALTCCFARTAPPLLSAARQCLAAGPTHPRCSAEALTGLLVRGLLGHSLPAHPGCVLPYSLRGPHT